MRRIFIIFLLLILSPPLVAQPLISSLTEEASAISEIGLNFTGGSTGKGKSDAYSVICAVVDSVGSSVMSGFVQAAKDKTVAITRITEIILFIPFPPEFLLPISCFSSF